MPSKNQGLKELFERICFYDDRAAFTDLFRMEYKQLYAYSMQFVKTHEAAEEVVNDVFVKLWRYRQSLSSVTNPESYLFIAVRNQSLNYSKKFSHIHISLSDSGQFSELTTQNGPQQELEWKEMNFEFQKTVDQLPAQCRKIFKLVKEEGLKTKQVAVLMNLSKRTVENQLQRAIKRIAAVYVEQIVKRKKRNNNIILWWLAPILVSML